MMAIVILSASVKRFSVSQMRIFFFFLSFIYVGFWNRLSILCCKGGIFVYMIQGRLMKDRTVVLGPKITTINDLLTVSSQTTPVSLMCHRVTNPTNSWGQIQLRFQDKSSSCAVGSWSRPSEAEWGLWSLWSCSYNAATLHWTVHREQCRVYLVHYTVYIEHDRDYSVKSNRYTRIENLAWSHSVFWQFSFCRKRRFMKPLLLSSVDTFCSFT